MRKLQFEIVGKSDPGCVRENNEDSLAVDENLGLMVVADGMGGHNSGEVASRLATETILQFARNMMGGPKELLPPEGGDPSLSPHGRQLEYFIKTANTMIFEKSKAFPQDHGMGTTVVAVLVSDGKAVVAHVGDSRLYLMRGGSLQAVTQDHSLVMDQVRMGLMTAEQADHSSLQNILTRALGTEEGVKVDVQEQPVLPGDVLLLCTDGLTKMVPEAKIAETLGAGSSALEMCDRLIAMARDGGGVDNVTTVIAKAIAPPGGVQRMLRKLFGK